LKILITGGENCGKSEFAENLAIEISSENKKKYYIATMKPCNEEGIKRIEKHREMRKNKGFVTIEKQTDIAEICNEKNIDFSGVFLLECLSNLVANEFFDLKNTSEKIYNDISKLSEKCENLILVTTIYESEKYSGETQNYIKIIDEISKKTAKKFDKVYEIKKGKTL
jgi:adenosylcobinamide kinase/adenosylcobinamide-phosphate guanylyltransferase